MNKVVIDGLVFADEGTMDGKLMDGCYYVQNSLSQDELSVDTLKINIRYPLDGTVDTKPIEWPYGTECKYFLKGKFFGKYYLESSTRKSRYEYELNFLSSIGLLDNSLHYGGIYINKNFADLIKEIIGDTITYEVDDIFKHTNLYGWLPIATKRENLKQVLFAVGAIIKKNPLGDPFFTDLSHDIVPTIIGIDRTFNGGSIEYNQSMNRIELTEHTFIKSPTATVGELFNNVAVGANFVSPSGKNILSGYMITFSTPHYDYEANVPILEESPNYIIIQVNSNTPNIVSGKEYVHNTNTVYREKREDGEMQRVALVKDATLVSASNSSSVCERLLAYYKNQDVLTSSVVSEGEQPTDSVVLPNPFGNSSSGFVKSIDGNMGATYTKADMEVALNYAPPSPYGVKALVRIEIIKKPDKVDYATNDYFDPTGMIVRAYYDDDTSDEVTHYVWTPTTQLKPVMKDVTIAYTEAKVTKTAVVPITVITKLKNIDIITPADRLRYDIGETFDPTGMEIRATYSDGSYRTLKTEEYTFKPDTPLGERDGTITISFTDTGVTAETYQDIIVGTAAPLTAIAVYKRPDKIRYEEGDFFDPTGMEIMAFYEDGYNQLVKGYRYSPTGALTTADNRITISYTSSGGTKYAYLDIEVVYFDHIYIDTPPTYTEYYEGDDFNPLNMVIKGAFSDGEIITIQPYEYSYSPVNLITDDKYVTISYYRRGKEFTVQQSINVEYYPYAYTHAIYLPWDPSNKGTATYDLSNIATHRNIKVVLIGGGLAGFRWNREGSPCYGENVLPLGEAIYNGSDIVCTGDWRAVYGISNYQVILRHPGYTDDYTTVKDVDSYKGYIWIDNKELGKPTPPGEGGDGGNIFEQDIILNRNNMTLTYKVGDKSTKPGEYSPTCDSYLSYVDNEFGLENNLNSNQGSKSPLGYLNIFTGELLGSSGLNGRPGYYSPWTTGTFKFKFLDSHEVYNTYRPGAESWYVHYQSGAEEKEKVTYVYDGPRGDKYVGDTADIPGNSTYELVQRGPYISGSSYINYGVNNCSGSRSSYHSYLHGYGILTDGAKGDSNITPFTGRDTYIADFNDRTKFGYYPTGSEKNQNTIIGRGGDGAHGSGGVGINRVWLFSQEHGFSRGFDFSKHIRDNVYKYLADPYDSTKNKFDRAGQSQWGGPGGIIIYYS